MDERNIQTGIDGCIIDLMPAFEKNNGGVFHMLPGGEQNPDWYGGNILDVYGFYSHELNKLRGGHYHPVLNEIFFPVAGTALWILCDFRPESPTFQKTISVVLGKKKIANTYNTPSYIVEEINRYARIKVPAGIYHAIAPLTPEGFTAIALGTTPFDKNDYQYPTFDDVPDMHNILKTFSIDPS